MALVIKRVPIVKHEDQHQTKPHHLNLLSVQSELILERRYGKIVQK